MNKEIVSRLTSKRWASSEYRRFVLSDLFYDGKVLKPEYTGVFAIDLISDDDCDFLVYNPLRRNIKRKMNYLLSRPFSIEGKEEVKKFMNGCVTLLKDTVKELYKKAEVWWEFEPDPKSPLKYRITLRKANDIVPKYTNEEKTEYDAVGYLWNKVDDDNVTHKYIDFVDLKGRHRYQLSGGETATAEEETVLPHAIRGTSKVTFSSLPFIKLEGDSLFSEIALLGKMYSDRYVQADTMLEDNAEPVAVIKNASDTDSDIIAEDIKYSRMVKVEGTGDFSYASPSQDFGSVNTFMQTVKSDIMDLCGVVSREQELSYVTSGRALDRLYVDMDADAAEMGSILREGLLSFLRFIDEQSKTNLQEHFDIIFNTDKPTDEQQIISNISSSSQFLSTRTLLEQHPWVKDVDEELKRKDDEKKAEQVQQEPELSSPEESSPEETPEELITQDLEVDEQ